MRFDEPFDLPFYPGSKTPVNDYTDQGHAHEWPEDDHLELGTPVSVEDGVEYFLIAAFAYALGQRSTNTIRNMIGAGNLPEARWSGRKVQGKGYPRWFSRQQIEDTVRIAREEGVLTEPRKQISKTRFVERVQEIW